MRQLYIYHDNVIYEPAVAEKVKWQTERKNSPGRLEFKAAADERMLSVSEGDVVTFSEDGEHLFYGYIFKFSRDRDNMISVTAYDQLRYFKNKDTYVYENKRADEVLRMLCDDFKLKQGTIESTGYKIPSRIESNSTLFDIIGNALDLTLQNKKILYVLYDDYGKITLKRLSSMQTGVIIDSETAENFSYSSGIDKDTYNRIKLSYDNSDSGQREIYAASDGGNISKWGVLQYYGTVDKNENGKEKAKALLSLYNAKTKTLSVKNALGVNKVRAGSIVYVQLDLGDMKINGGMVVEKCSHEYGADSHFMTLELRGGEINA